MLSLKYAILSGALLAVIVTMYQQWRMRGENKAMKEIKKWLKSQRSSTPEERKIINIYLESKSKKSNQALKRNGDKAPPSA